MKKVYQIFGGFLFVGLFWFWGASYVFAGQCQTQIIFDIKPNPAGFNQSVTFSGTISFNGSVLEPPNTPNAGYCLDNRGNPVKAFYVSSENNQFGYVNSADITIRPNDLGPYPFSTTVKPSDRGLKAGQTFDFIAVAYSRPGAWDLVRSSIIKLTLSQGVYGTYACVASDGKYACSPGNLSNCSDVTGCTAQQKQACRSIPDSSQCGKPAPTAATHKACQNNSCVNVSGSGTDTCATDANCITGGGGSSSTNVFNLENPIGAENFQDLINIIGKWIFNLAIPIAVIMIIYAGVLMLTAGDKPAQFQKGTKALWYAVLGLAVVLIGKGFVTLVQSILNLRNQ